VEEQSHMDPPQTQSIDISTDAGGQDLQDKLVNDW
jgi:hypothetical protein